MPFSHCYAQAAVQRAIRSSLLGPIAIGNIGAEMDDFLTKLLLEQRCAKDF